MEVFGHVYLRCSGALLCDLRKLHDYIIKRLKAALSISAVLYGGTYSAFILL